MTKFLHFNNVTVKKHRSKAFRKHYQSRTVAVDPLTSNEVMDTAGGFLVKRQSTQLFVELNVGVTFVSDQDNYNKKTGRTEAIKRMKKEQIFVESVTINDTHIFVHLVPFKGIQLNLRLNKTSGFSTITGSIVGR